MDNLITCPGQEIFIGLLIFYFKKLLIFVYVILFITAISAIINKTMHALIITCACINKPKPALSYNPG